MRCGRSDQTVFFISRICSMGGQSENGRFLGTHIPVTTPSETGTSTGTKMTVPSTIEEKTCKKNDVKAKEVYVLDLHCTMNINLPSTIVLMHDQSSKGLFSKIGNSGCGLLLPDNLKCKILKEFTF
ncbi:hypothetical protein Tco_1041824 [Tanacetum coccineum]|uniref:Uncharacterized protein n=1 Tax=Tanacetum coccineum TaxID=301880 RepID=A0ABQ5GI07_9ASTR